MRRSLINEIIQESGNQILQLFEAKPDGSLDQDADVTVRSDAAEKVVPSGGHLKLGPGQSVTLKSDCWHAFWGEGGRVLIGEVSNVNDDLTDNVFCQPIGRFSQIEEDEGPDRLLVSDYDK